MIPDELLEPPVSKRTQSSDRIVAPPAEPPPTPPVLVEHELAPPIARPETEPPPAIPAVALAFASPMPAPTPLVDVPNTAVEIAPTPIAAAAVSIESIVIKPELPETNVAAILGTVREPVPTTFGALIDGVLSL